MSDVQPNPYQSPDFKDHLPNYGPGYDNPYGLSAAILTQQRVIAILMIVQGTLSLLTGLFYAGIAFVFPAMVAADMKRQGGPQVENMQTILLATYGTMAACGIIPGLVQIFAGIQNLWLKGYVLGMVGLGVGAISFGTCYCIPTAAALLVYGLVIYLNQTTKRAFDMAKQGQTYDDIMRLAR